jgi:hypothetical protein
VAEKKTYSDKLKDPRWQKKRLEILERDGWACRQCGDDKNTLHVHHVRYLPKREPWDYPSEMLMALCADCHQVEYEERQCAEHDLLAMLKDRGFFTSDVWVLVDGIHRMDMPHKTEVVMCAIRWALTAPGVLEKIVDAYLTGLTANRQEAPTQP